MEDDVLQQILAVQTEILAELRLLREAMAAGVPVRPIAARTTAPQPASQPVASQPAAPQPSATRLDEPLAAAPQPSEPVAAAPQPVPQASAPVPEPEPEPSPVEPSAPPRRSGSGMMTMDELTELGGQFLESIPRPKARTRPTDVSDLGGSLLDEIKAKNRAKRDAFAEFDRLRRDR